MAILSQIPSAMHSTIFRFFFLMDRQRNISLVNYLLRECYMKLVSVFYFFGAIFHQYFQYN